MNIKNYHAGFTLIELAIVLVIIGLIAGGVLVGRDLIYNAMVRKAIKQVEDFNAAGNTFKTKYNCLPGDCPNADSFGFGYTVGASNYSSNGDGNGVIGGPRCWFRPGDACNLTTMYMEYVDFWYHLSAAGLIPDNIQGFYNYTSYIPGDDSAYIPAGIASPRVPILAKPDAAATAGGSPFGWAIESWGIIHSTIGGVTYDLPPHHFTLSPWVQPVVSSQTDARYRVNDIWYLDRKMDDGLPTSGAVRAWSYFNYTPGANQNYTLRAGPEGASFCGMITNPLRYNTTWFCSVLIKAAF